MQNVHVRQTAAGPFEPMVEIAGLEEGGVERLSIERDERAGTRQLAGDGFEQRSLVGMPRQHELPRHESAVAIEPAAADEKRLRAGPAAQAGGLEIEEHERRPGRRIV